MKRYAKTLVLVSIALFGLASTGWAFPGNPDQWQTNNLRLKANGFFESTGGDPYIVFPVIDQCKCKLKQVQFLIDFEIMPSKPIFMEFFWSTDIEGFSENKKVFFVLFPNFHNNTIDFTIPLDDVIPYTQSISNIVHTLRIDFPMETKTAFRIKDVRLHHSNQHISDSLRIDPFYALLPRQMTSTGILTAHTATLFKHGLKKLWRDPVFVVVWLVSMAGLVFGARRIKMHL